MKKVTLLIVFISVFCIAEEKVLQENTPETEEKSYSSITRKRYSNYIGFAGGTTTGYGLSYRKWIKNSWAFQINLLPFYREDNYDSGEEDDNTYWDRDSGFYDWGTLSLGLTYLKKVIDGKYVRFLFYTGANLSTDYEKYDYYKTNHEWNPSLQAFTDSVVHKSGKDVDNKISLGSGVGWEWYVWRMAFHAMAGLMAEYEIESKSPGIGPTFEAGVHFRFDSKRNRK